MDGTMVTQQDNAECGIRDAELQERTKRFGIEVIRLIEDLPRNRVTDVIVKQLVRSGTSIGANYRAACRAKSRADFISKMGTVEEEADESRYWMEVLIETNMVAASRVQQLVESADAILGMTVASIRTARKNG